MCGNYCSIKMQIDFSDLNFIHSHIDIIPLNHRFRPLSASVNPPADCLRNMDTELEVLRLFIEFPLHHLMLTIYDLTFHC